MAVDGGWEAATGGRRRLVWLGVAAVVAVAVVAAGVLAGGEGDDSLVVEDADEPALPPAVAEPTPATPEAPGEWESAPGPPAPAEDTVLWTGREALAWSPSGLIAFDPTGPSEQAASPRAWRTLGGPLPARTEPALAWAPHADAEPGAGLLLVWGGRALDGPDWPEDGALYDTTADAWRTLPEAPLEPRRGALAVWSGEKVLIAGGVDPDGRPRADAAAYDPATETWRRLPDLPGRVLALEWVERQAVAVLHPHAGATSHAVVSYRPGQDRWREGPALPAPDVMPDGLVATVIDQPRGSRLVVWGGGDEGSGRLWLLDHWAQRWEEIPAAPLADRMRPALAWTGDGLLVWGGHRRAGPRRDGAVYVPQAEEWRILPDGPLPDGRGAAAVWTGAESLVFAGSAGAGWRPEGAVPLLADAPAARVHLATAGRIATVSLPSRVVTGQRSSAIAAGGPQPLAAVGDTLVYGGYPETFLVPAAGGEERVLSRSQEFVPDTLSDRVWLVRGGRDGATVAPFDVDEGAQTRPDRPLPGGWVHAATDYGLVITEPEGHTVVWDPDRDRIVWQADELLFVAAGRAHLATCEALGSCTQLAITHLGGEARHEVAVPEGEFALHTAAFSPDDTRLAVPVHRRGGIEVVVVHLEGPARTIALGDVTGVPHLAWHPTLPWLFLAVDGRLLAVPPDADEARLVGDGLPEEVYGIAVTDPAAERR